MRRLVLAALCTGVLACHAGPPIPDEPTPDAGLPDGGSPLPDGGTQGLTLQGTTYYLGGTTLEQAPRPFGTPEERLPKVLFSDGAGGFTPVTGQVVAEGQVFYPNVPLDSGPVWLELDNGWHQITASPAVFNLAVPARKKLTGFPGQEAVTLNFTGLEAWKHEVHELELFVPSQNMFRGPYSSSLSQSFSEGSTSATSAVTADQLSVGALSPSEGDRVYVYQVDHTVISSTPPSDFSSRVVAAGVITDLSLPSASGAQRTVPMNQAPKRAVSIQVDAPGFEAASERPSTPTRDLSIRLLVEAHQPVPAGAYEAWRNVPTLVERFMLDRSTQLSTAPTQSFSWATSYADAFAASAPRFVSATFTTATTLIEPEGGQRQRPVIVSTRQRVPAEGTWTLSPVISVPRQVRIEGVEKDGVTTVSGRAHLSWSAPTRGTASSYFIEIYFVNQANYVLGRFHTSSTEFVIPINLQEGRLHYAVITALGKDGEREGSASALSGFFRGP